MPLPTVLTFPQTVEVARPLNRQMKWGLSVLDWHSHAIDERGDHPVGVFKASAANC
jgi:hypothetical protein